MDQTLDKTERACSIEIMKQEQAATDIDEINLKVDLNVM